MTLDTLIDRSVAAQQISGKSSAQFSLIRTLRIK
jgi:hypothetical protein